MTAPLRVANVSGFYGDRLSAMREMLDGGPVDVLTGDYLAELTMLILGRDTMKDPSLGYARTFVRQVEDVLGDALERGVKIVSNAGGLNPAGLAARLEEVARGLGLAPSIAYVSGDDLRSRTADLGWGDALTANAYLGGFGIAAALSGGADIVVTGRVTDASLVVGPAVAHFGWSYADLDALAGAVVAGHVIECGTQATGGNFSGFLELSSLEGPLGFPIAEIAADGSCVITKHPGTGGAVTVDTVTAQLCYEIQGPAYLGPDVTAHLDSLELSDVGPDRVAISGVRGSEPPSTLKVCLNSLGGFRNTAEFVVTGLAQSAKVAWLRRQLEAAWGDLASSVTWTHGPAGVPGADTEEGASTRLRATVKSADPKVAGKAFTAPAIELALGSYPGFTLTAPPAPGSPYGVYRAAYVERDAVTHVVTFGGGASEVIANPGLAPRAGSSGPESAQPPEIRGLSGQNGGLAGPTRPTPLGTFVHARSGDKGGDANLGLWVGAGPKRDERVDWLLTTVTAQWVRDLIPEAAELEIDIHPLPNLGAVNIVLHGLLGDAVAASTRFEPQAKGLGEWARARTVQIPVE